MASSSSSSSQASKTVCVTGANGFIGSWLVRALLDKGYAVRGTFQQGTDTSHLLSLPGASTRLSLFEADLLDPHAIQAAVTGSSGVFHVASPCTLAGSRDPHLELVLPAVQGTLNVLEASRMVKARRVVLTSSISALVPNPGWPHHAAPVDESSWTDLDYCKSRQKWYPVSKTMAEKAAWDYSKRHGIDIVTVHPSTCLGPLLQQGLNASSALLRNLLQGSKDTQEYHWLGCVHVRDVANAHVLLFETPCASGRYLCTNGIYQFKDFAETVANLCPEYPIHRFEEETQPGLMECKDAAMRLIDLGLVFTPIEEIIQDAVESLKERGFVMQSNMQ
ncbi:cinnamoyl-CoA reductase 2 [Cinnamomum micranthum f. kanehirae]|uniref:Cinnamoyl-CoA reductase 2 n=1 Tax=Cinnamomum micranthum f. kanehirae TaxID=337451 RepID=A0A3S3P099_9MAGN|nr:cinnamoyl-CoA reductase 2 [Cinnamomum micranthum f. kanehirae]